MKYVMTAWMGIPLEQFRRGQKSQESIFQMKREESRLGRFYHHEEEIPEDPISASFFPVNDEDVLRVPYSMKVSTTSQFNIAFSNLKFLI